MNDPCHSECDCGWPGPDYGPHDPDCRSLDVCDGEMGSWCEKHWAQEMYENAWMRGYPLSVVTGRLSDMTEEQKADLRDAGRGHLLP